jgi:hypothetical protein
MKEPVSQARQCKGEVRGYGDGVVNIGKLNVASALLAYNFKGYHHGRPTRNDRHSSPRAGDLEVAKAFCRRREGEGNLEGSYLGRKDFA